MSNNPWDQRYAQTDYLYGADANQFIQEISAKISLQGKTLGIAEGEGRNLLHLARLAKAQNLPFEGQAWDLSQVALQKAQQRADAENLAISTHWVDLDTVTWVENSFQNAICVFGHMPKPLQQSMLLGVRQSVVNQGWFIGEVYSEKQVDYGTGGPRDSHFLYKPQLFLDVFEQDHIQHFFMGEVERFEGELHSGRCHVIQFAIQIKK